MVLADKVREGKGGDLAERFTEVREGEHDALPGGADPREVAAALRAMRERREAANEAEMHRDC